MRSRVLWAVLCVSTVLATAYGEGLPWRENLEHAEALRQ
jgi:hypothetical protein